MNNNFLFFDETEKASLLLKYCLEHKKISTAKYIIEKSFEEFDNTYLENLLLSLAEIPQVSDDKLANMILDTFDKSLMRALFFSLHNDEVLSSENHTRIATLLNLAAKKQYPDQELHSYEISENTEQVYRLVKSQVELGLIYNVVYLVGEIFNKKDKAHKILFFKPGKSDERCLLEIICQTKVTGLLSDILMLLFKSIEFDFLFSSEFIELLSSQKELFKSVIPRLENNLDLVYSFDDKLFDFLCKHLLTTKKHVTYINANNTEEVKIISSKCFHIHTLMVRLNKKELFLSCFNQEIFSHGLYYQIVKDSILFFAIKNEHFEIIDIIIMNSLSKECPLNILSRLKPLLISKDKWKKYQTASDTQLVKYKTSKDAAVSLFFWGLSDVVLLGLNEDEVIKKYRSHGIDLVFSFEKLKGKAAEKRLKDIMKNVNTKIDTLPNEALKNLLLIFAVLGLTEFCNAILEKRPKLISAQVNGLNAYQASVRSAKCFTAIRLFEFQLKSAKNIPKGYFLELLDTICKFNDIELINDLLKTFKNSDKLKWIDILFKDMVYSKHISLILSALNFDFQNENKVRNQLLAIICENEEILAAKEFDKLRQHFEKLQSSQWRNIIGFISYESTGNSQEKRVRFAELILGTNNPIFKEIMKSYQPVSLKTSNKKNKMPKAAAEKPSLAKAIQPIQTENDSALKSKLLILNVENLKLLNLTQDIIEKDAQYATLRKIINFKKLDVGALSDNLGQILDALNTEEDFSKRRTGPNDLVSCAVLGLTEFCMLVLKKDPMLAKNVYNKKCPFEWAVNARQYTTAIAIFGFELNLDNYIIPKGKFLELLKGISKENLELIDSLFKAFKDASKLSAINNLFEDMITSERIDLIIHVLNLNAHNKQICNQLLAMVCEHEELLNLKEQTNDELTMYFKTLTPGEWREIITIDEYVDFSTKLEISSNVEKRINFAKRVLGTEISSLKFISERETLLAREGLVVQNAGAAKVSPPKLSGSSEPPAKKTSAVSNFWREKMAGSNNTAAATLLPSPPQKILTQATETNPFNLELKNYMCDLYNIASSIIFNNEFNTKFYLDYIIKRLAALANGDLSMVALGCIQAAYKKFQEDVDKNIQNEVLSCYFENLLSAKPLSEIITVTDNNFLLFNIHVLKGFVSLKNSCLEEAKAHFAAAKSILKKIPYFTDKENELLENLLSMIETQIVPTYPTPM